MSRRDDRLDHDPERVDGDRADAAGADRRDAHRRAPACSPARSATARTTRSRTSSRRCRRRSGTATPHRRAPRPTTSRRRVGLPVHHPQQAASSQGRPVHGRSSCRRRRPPTSRCGATRPTPTWPRTELTLIAELPGAGARRHRDHRLVRAAAHRELATDCASGRIDPRNAGRDALIAWARRRRRWSPGLRPHQRHAARRSATSARRWSRCCSSTRPMSSRGAATRISTTTASTPRRSRAASSRPAPRSRVIFPMFALGYFAFYEIACDSDAARAPRAAQHVHPLRRAGGPPRAGTW